MIQANELRIGNYVGSESNSVFDGRIRGLINALEVVSIDSKGINAWQDHGASGIVKFEELFGLLLTEEWLLKFRFEVVLWNGVIRQYFIHITENKRCALSFHFGEFIGFPDRLDKVTIGSPPHESGTTFGRFQIQYVHQLQNLYFALTGKELELKKEGTIYG